MAGDERSFLVLRFVFLRLPWKLLFRFKAVCKDWNSIIADPSFAVEYRKYFGRSSPLQYAGYFLYPTRDIDPYPRVPVRFFGNGALSERELTSELYNHNSFHPDAERFLLCSSNGILLCYSWETVLRRKRKCRKTKSLRYYVCNPLTSEWRALPFPPINKEGVVGFHCREQELREPVSSGCCYEYEVVSVHIPDNSFRSVVHVYSSKSGRWSVRFCPLENPNNCSFWTDSRDYLSIVIRGVFYWFDCHGASFAYDPSLHRLEVRPQPPAGWGYWTHWFSFCEILNNVLAGYVSDENQLTVWSQYCQTRLDERPPVWHLHLHVKYADLAELHGKFENLAEFQGNFPKGPRLNPMPGNPGKILLGAPGILEYSFEMLTGKLEKLPHGQESSLGRMYDKYYCPYHLPSWYFRLQQQKP